MAAETFNVYFVNSMFNFQNFTNSFDYFIDDQLFFNIDPARIKQADFFI